MMMTMVTHDVDRKERKKEIYFLCNLIYLGPTTWALEVS